jgi:hypothetical protein
MSREVEESGSRCYTAYARQLVSLQKTSETQQIERHLHNSYHHCMHGGVDAELLLYWKKSLHEQRIFQLLAAAGGTPS